MNRSRQLAILLGSLALVAACDDNDFENVIPANANVSMQDQCDSASFNAALGAGTCVHAGNTTFAAFNNELNATQQVALWRFVPSALNIRLGQKITAMNDGGEEHTFTEVDEFGGGIIPALNQASGETTVAPECQALAAGDIVASGGTFTTDAATEVGTEKYQCCIHPWMRATVTVNQ